MTDSSYARTGTTHHSPESPDAIEQEVNAERHRVAETLDALQEKMSVGNMVDDAVRSFSRYGGDMAGSFSRQVRHNPLPLLLTGVGLAWLMASSTREQPRYRYRDEDYLWDADEELDEDLVATRRYGQSARPYGTAGVAGTYDDRAYDDRDSGPSTTGPSTTDRIRGTAGSAASSVGGAASSATRGVGGAAGSAASGVSGAHPASAARPDRRHAASATRPARPRPA